MGKGKPLTEKQARYLKELPRTKSKKEAALKAGYSQQTAENAHQQIEIPIERVAKTRMQEAFEAAGLNEAGIAKVIKEATEADHAVYIRKGIGPVTSVETVFRPDHSTRVRAVDIAGKFRSDYIERQEHSGPNGGPIIVETKLEIIGVPKKIR